VVEARTGAGELRLSAQTDSINNIFRTVQFTRSSSPTYGGFGISVSSRSQLLVDRTPLSAGTVVAHSMTASVAAPGLNDSLAPSAVMIEKSFGASATSTLAEGSRR